MQIASISSRLHMNRSGNARWTTRTLLAMRFLDDIRSRRAWKVLKAKWPTIPDDVRPPRDGEALQQATEADILRKTKLLVAQPDFDARVSLDFATWTRLRTRDAAVEALRAARLTEAAAYLASVDDPSTIASIAERLIPESDDLTPATRQALVERGQRWLDEIRRNPPELVEDVVGRARSDPAFAERTLREEAAQAVGQVLEAAKVYQRDEFPVNRSAAAARAAGMATFAGMAAGTARQVEWLAEAIRDASFQVPPPALSVGYNAEFRAQIDWLSEHVGRR
jgi:hypothetical protein